jgi:oleandomycin transport system ATP-binding protein
MEEADQLCHDITVIDHGKVIASGTPNELKAKVGGQVLAVTPADESRVADIEALIARRTGLTPVIESGSGTVTVPVPDSALVPALFRELDDKGIAVDEFALRKASLDEVFFALTASPGGTTPRTPPSLPDTAPAQGGDPLEPPRGLIVSGRHRADSERDPE